MHVAVIGAGIFGSALARALHREGHDVHVFDQAAGPGHLHLPPVTTVLAKGDRSTDAVSRWQSLCANELWEDLVALDTEGQDRWYAFERLADGAIQGWVDPARLLEAWRAQGIHVTWGARIGNPSELQHEFEQVWICTGGTLNRGWLTVPLGRNLGVALHGKSGQQTRGVSILPAAPHPLTQVNTPTTTMIGSTFERLPEMLVEPSADKIDQHVQWLKSKVLDTALVPWLGIRGSFPDARPVADAKTKLFLGGGSKATLWSWGLANRLAREPDSLAPLFSAERFES